MHYSTSFPENPFNDEGMTSLSASACTIRPFRELCVFSLTANTYSHVGAGIQTEAINKLVKARESHKVSPPFQHLFQSLGSLSGSAETNNFSGASGK